MRIDDAPPQLFGAAYAADLPSPLVVAFLILPREWRAFTELCELVGQAYYLPTIQTEKRRQDRPREVRRCIEPLFPGYVFLAGNNWENIPRYEFQLLAVPNEMKLRSELAEVESRLATDPCGAEWRTIPVGQRVIVTRGVFRGITGTTLTPERRGRRTVGLDGGGAYSAVEIDATALEVA
jgi:transcription antitermination factor NusG